jgi:hypothetical protein
MARIQNRPPVTSLYPQAAASGKKWLLPIVERLAWALDRDEKQADALAMMLTLSLEGAGRISEAEFLKLAAFAEAISAKYTYAFITYVDGLCKFLKGIEEAATPGLRAAAVLEGWLGLVRTGLAGVPRGGRLPGKRHMLGSTGAP